MEKTKTYGTHSSTWQHSATQTWKFDFFGQSFIKIEASRRICFFKKNVLFHTWSRGGEAGCRDVCDDEHEQPFSVFPSWRGWPALSSACQEAGPGNWCHIRSVDLCGKRTKSHLTYPREENIKSKSSYGSKNKYVADAVFALNGDETFTGRSYKKTSTNKAISHRRRADII